jgi:hypothetical protein
MSEDKELLTLAAKAAGMDGIGLFWNDRLKCLWDAEGLTFDPLEDDGDALRLAVKLRLDVMTDCPNSVCIEVPVGKKDNWITENTGDDSFENVLIATRRAIVRAASEIGMADKFSEVV